MSEPRDELLKIWYQLRIKEEARRLADLERAHRDTLERAARYTGIQAYYERQAAEILKHRMAGVKGYITRLQKQQAKLIGRFYRIQKAILYYARTKKKDTPTPLATIRVYVYTQMPERYKLEEFEDELADVEEAFDSLRIAMAEDAIYTEQETLEIQEVDEDEVTTTLDDVQLETEFYDAEGKVSYAYDDKDVRRIMAETHRKISQFRTDTSATAAGHGNIPLDYWMRHKKYRIGYT